MRLSAIVVAFGKESLLEECVSRLAAAVGRVDGESELIVVLNHVSAVARERLERRTPLVVTVAGGPELGFAGGVAAGLAVARGEWIALVNDDCALLPDALRCVLAPRAIALHHHSPTLGHGSNAKHLLVGRNRVRMLAKNASRGQLRRRLLRIVAYDLLYVSYAAAVARTRAPLTGRLRGLRDWRADRTAGRPGRREIELAPPPGLLAALRRNRVYRSA